MRREMRAALVVATMSAVAVVPAAIVMSITTVDAAHAKGGNGKGNGGGTGNASDSRGGGKDNAARGAGKPSRASQGGRSGIATAQRGGPDPVGVFLNRLTGQDKKQARQASRTAPTKRAPVTSVAPAKRPDAKPLPGSRAAQLTGLHPSALGNMNGALNADINAVMAHMENGNFNGPVGHMAAIALASVDAAEAEEILSTPEGMEYHAFYSALDASEYETFDDYLAAVEADPTVFDSDLETAYFSLGTSDLETALADAGYEDYDSYVAARDADPSLADPSIADAHAGLGSFDATVTDLYGGAHEDLAGLAEAQGALLAYWNKDDPDSLEDDEKLLAGVIAHIEQNFDVIAATSETMDADESAATAGEKGGEDLIACGAPAGCETDEDLASAN